MLCAAKRRRLSQPFATPSRPAGAAWWRYYRDFDPNLASIRNEPEFKAVFADIERDMAQQRAASPRVRRMRRLSCQAPCTSQNPRRAPAMKPETGGRRLD